MALANENGYRVISEPYEYIFNICGPLKDESVCGDGAKEGLSACETRKFDNGTVSKTAIGYTKSQRLFLNDEDDRTFLEYANEKNGCKLTLDFVCDNSGVESKPTFERKDGKCSFFVRFPTRITCKGAAEAIMCVAVDNASSTEYDFSELISNGKPEVADLKARPLSGKGGEVYVNVCKAAGPKLCKGKASVCYVYEDKGATINFSMGNPVKPPFVDEFGKIIVESSGGDKCPNTGKEAKSRIHFVCDKDGLVRALLLMVC